MTKMAYDLRAINKADKGIAAFAVKRDAIAFAKSCGWSARDVTRAYNRFQLFWIVAQPICDDLRILTVDRGVFDMANPGRN